MIILLDAALFKKPYIILIFGDFLLFFPFSHIRTHLRQLLPLHSLPLQYFVYIASYPNMIRNLHSGDSFHRINLEHGIYEIQATFRNSGFYFNVEGIFSFFY
jgi:hypothetical protein